VIDLHTLALELVAAYAERRPLARPPRLAMVSTSTTAYASRASSCGCARGRPQDRGVKVGFANKAVWRVHEARHARLGAHVRRHGAYRERNEATLSLAQMISPKIEPEIVFKMKSPLGAGRH
jgi:2-keto-4-pentenoate hydratase